VIGATLRTITGRKGTFVGGTAVLFGATVLVLVFVIVLHVLRPGRNPSVGGQNMLDGTAGAVVLLGVVVAVLIGSLAGSYDAAQGTMRYLVMTGSRRGRIYAARTVALLLAVLLALAPALLLGCVTAVLLPHRALDAVEAGEVADVVWTSVLFATVFALISMGIGTVMRSNGPAIAISLVFFLGFTPLLLLVDRASPTLGDLMLPDVLDRLTGADTGQSIPVSAVGLGVWVGVFWAAGRLRVQRDEY